MARPIDANWLKENLGKVFHQECDHLYGMMQLIDEAPTLTPPNEPLTIEQLREMVGMPVLVQCLNPRTRISPSTGWYFLDKSITGNVFAININNYFIERDYGTEWIAYAYPPAHIDREAWTAEWKNHYRSGTIPGLGCVCSFCDMWNERGSDFCPHCGRAMTPEAWNELEKRLRG